MNRHLLVRPITSTLFAPRHLTQVSRRSPPHSSTSASIRVHLRWSPPTPSKLELTIPSLSLCAPPCYLIQTFTRPFTTTTTTTTMSPAADPDKNSDILKWADNGGEFKRQVSAFRDEIKPGGKFEPEKQTLRR